MSSEWVTIEQYSLMPDPDDGTRDELICGRVIRYPLADLRHGVCCSTVACFVEEFNKSSGMGVTTLRCGFIAGQHPDSVVAPDLLFWRIERRPHLDNSWPEVSPDLAVAVLDPGESEERERRAARFYGRGRQFVFVGWDEWCESHREPPCDWAFAVGLAPLVPPYNAASPSMCPSFAVSASTSSGWCWLTSLTSQRSSGLRYSRGGSPAIR